MTRILFAFVFLWILSPFGHPLIAQDGSLPLEGYAWPLSGAPGDSIDFYISGEDESVAEFLRHKANGNVDVMDSRTFRPSVQPIDEDAPRTGAGWERTFTLRIPGEWPSGIYSARLSSNGRVVSYIPFVVKPHHEKRSNLAVLVNVNTALAYNRWGGDGKYRHNDSGGPAQFSFLRPNHRAAPFGERFNQHHLTRAELWILGWLEEVREEHPDVYTDIDFHNGLVHKAGYTTLVLSTHPEYWTKQMYENLQAFLKGGGSLLYLGGNGIYENAEYTDNQTAMVFLQSGARANSLFRRLNPPSPERAILGVATERCGVGKPLDEDSRNDTFPYDLGGGYEVRNAEHPFLRGLVEPGELLGDDGLNTGGGMFNGKASAWEIDTRAGNGASGIPDDCASGSTREFPVPNPAADSCRQTAQSRIGSLERRIEHFQALYRGADGRGKMQVLRIIQNLNQELESARGDLRECAFLSELPPNLQLLAVGRNWCAGSTRQPTPSAPTGITVIVEGECVGQWFGAEIVTYDHPGGGVVFSVGSITFGGSLVVDQKLQSIVLRVLAEADRRATRR